MKDAKVRLMEVCGTHTMAIARAGIKEVLPGNIELISGPGCPVCVTAQQDIERALAVARLDDVVMTTFGDMMRVPGARTSLQALKTQGHDIRVVYSCLDALQIARRSPQKKIVFMGVGFETTSPTVAATIAQAKREGIRNFFVLSNFKLIFPALEAIARAKRVGIDGFICPGHVSVITGSGPYEKISRRYKMPCVIAGFEPADILRGIGQLLDKIKNRDYEVGIAYDRVVRRQGNKTARRVLDDVFEIGDAAWRGLGVIKKSGLKLRKAYRHFDAEEKIPVDLGETAKDGRNECLCGAVLQGISSPRDCRLFGRRCTPENPVGPCMVSSEGTCAACYRYGRAGQR